MAKQGLLVIVIVLLLVVNIATLFYFFNFTGKVVDTTSDEDENNSIASKNDFSPRSEGLEEKYVGKVIDGDTVIVDGESIRLLGMDTDERGYPCFNVAKKRIEELILGKKVVLEKDVEDKDQYDRYLRYIFLNGKNINLQMVEEGLAVSRFSPKNQKYKNEILEAEANARDNKVGCKWSGKSQVSGTGTNNLIEDVKKNDSTIIAPKNKLDNNVANNSLGYICNSNTYNCGDFRAQKEAKEAFDACGGVGNDVHGLDNDKDGVPCESLP